MKYLLFDTSKEQYFFSNVRPADESDFDIIDLENKHILSGPSGAGPLTEFAEDAEEEAESAEEEEHVPPTGAE